MKIELDEGKLKDGVLGLVLALVEIIRDTLRCEAVRRMEGGRLSDAEVERLGNALRELDVAIEHIKEDNGVSEAVRNVRDGLDDLVNDSLDALLQSQHGNGSKVKQTPLTEMPGQLPNKREKSAGNPAVSRLGAVQ